MTEDEFRSRLAGAGYGDERVLHYDAHHTPDLHVHEFSAMGMVTGGELTIVREDDATTYGVGEWYEVTAGCVHAEHTGDRPATALLGVKAGRARDDAPTVDHGRAVGSQGGGWLASRP